MLERDLQAKVVTYARKQGAIARKLDFGQGWPDYLMLYSGVVVFVEFKAFNGRLSLLQAHVIKVLRDQDFTVEVCKDMEEGTKIVDQLILRGTLLRQRKPS